MDINFWGSIASLVSLLFSIWALWNSFETRSLIRSRAINSRIRNNFKDIKKIPIDQELTSASRKLVGEILKDLDDFFLSKYSFLDKEPKVIIHRIKENLQGATNVDQLKKDLRALENLVFCTGRI